MKPLSAVVFDFDGTLAPLNINFDLLKAEVKRIALSYVEESFLSRIDHLYTLEMIYEIQLYLGEKAKEFRNAAFSKLDEMEIAFASEKELFPEARQVLKSLKEMGMRLAIITRNCTEAVKRVFPDYREYVEVIVSREDVSRVKPHPEHPKKALHALRVKPNLSIICGDHPTDIIAGKAIGSSTVAVLTGRTKEEELLKVGADYVIPSIEALPDLIRTQYFGLV